MEKITIQPNEVQVMPSYFQSINSSESHPLVSWDYLQQVITHDENLKIYTETYRKKLVIGKRFADEYKVNAPCITISALMDGYGKSLANFVKPTYFLMLDFDHVGKEKLKQCQLLLDQDPYVFCRYVTVGGRGFRIFCRYEPLDDEDLTILELFDFMIHKAMNYFTQLLGIKPDEACTDITRSAGLAYDPDAYFNQDAVPFRFDNSDYKAFYSKMANEAKYAKRTAKKKSAKSATCRSARYGSGTPTIDEAAPHIKSLLTQWGYQFESGQHNAYIVQFAKLCIRYGIEQESAISYANSEFGHNYKETLSVMKSCYKHTEHFGEWHFYRKGEEMDKRPSIKAIKQWLSTHYEFHHNEVTGSYEIRSRMVITGKYPLWTFIDDNIAHSLWLEMSDGGFKVSTSTIQDIICSDFSESYNPLEDYLWSLESWDEKKDPDYIDQLADRIRVADRSNYNHTQELFRYFFKKWLVGMVVTWCNPKVVNQMILILVGKGGIFKTTFFAYLLPPQLRSYFINDSTACYVDKDFQEALSSKALACLDEFETIFGKNLSAFKSCITKLSFSIRRPYDKFRTELLHRGSLCGTSNSQQFITDEENRRYSPWIVESIESPIEHPIDYAHVYAEAVALGKKVTDCKERKPDDWVFWLTPDDIEVMRRHNRLFMVANYAEEQILRFYRVPRPDTDPQFIKFRYSAEILERIGGNPALRQNLNNQNIGTVMSRLGFKKVHKEKGNGWAVVEKEGSEINNDSFYDPHDPLED